MKKIVFVANVILFAIICVFYIVGIDQTDSIKSDIGTPKAIKKIEENATLTEENILKTLEFNGEALPYDEASATFYLPLSMKTQNWEYGELTSGTNGVSILFTSDFKKQNKQDAIAANESFSFLAFTKQEYRYYNIVFTGLPMMSITVNEGSLSEQAGIEMSLYSSDSKLDWVKRSLANIRVRGNTSRMYPKNGYKLELTKQDNSGKIVKNDMSLLGMRKDNDWILYAMYNDSTKIRDKLSIDIWNQFGAKDNPYSKDFSTKLEYIELVVNGEYYGIYGLMEPVDAKKLDITKSNDVNSQEYIYKKKGSSFLTMDEFTEESDTIERGGFELKGVSKYGEISLKSWEPLMNFIKVYNLKDDAYRQQIADVIDINSATNAWLFLQIVTGTDNIGKNMYYVAKMTNEGIRLFFVPWDLDLTWGNVSKDERYPPLFTAYEPEVMTDVINWEPGQRVVDLNVDDSVSKVKKKWDLLRSTILTDEMLTKQIDQLAHKVLDSGAMQRETNRWPEGGHTNDFSSIKQYALDKMEYLDSYFAMLSKE